MFTVEGQGLHWENGKWLDEGNIVYAKLVSTYDLKKIFIATKDM
jgi:hypothetical protein